LHINITEVATQAGKCQRFVAIARICKFAYAALNEKKSKRIAAQLLRNLIAVLPHRIYPILTDNGIQSSHRKKDKHAFEHIFDRLCWQRAIEHRLTRVNLPGPMARSRA